MLAAMIRSASFPIEVKEVGSSSVLVHQGETALLGMDWRG
jgi:hypothetical protein